MYIKNFLDWNKLKINVDSKSVIDDKGKVNLLAKERELWWCHFGVNIGSEVDGKNADFERPVLIINKLSPTTYLVAPTTSKVKENEFRITVYGIEGKYSIVLIDQIKVIDVRRLKRKVDVIIEEDFIKLKEQICKLTINCEIPLTRDFSEPEGTVSTV